MDEQRVEAEAWVGLVKAVNGQDIATIYTEHPTDDSLWIFIHPMEVYFHDYVHDSADFELVDWLPANQDKEIMVKKNMVFSINLIREDIEEVYNQYLETAITPEYTKNEELEEQSSDNNVINIFNK